MRFILRLLSVVVGVVALALVLVLVLPGQKLAQLAARQIEAQTGREVRFDGDVRFMFWPTLGLRANDVSFANASWAGPAPMLSAGRLNIGVDAAALLGGELRVTELTAIVPEVNLATNSAGRGNWELDLPGAGQGGRPDPQADAAEPATPISIEALSVSGARLTYAPYGEEVVELKQVDLTLALPAGREDAQLSATLRPFAAPLTVQGSVAGFVDFLAGQSSEADLQLAMSGATARYKGQIALDGALAGQVTAEIPDSDALAKGLGLEALGLPKGLGQAVALSSRLAFAPEQMQVRLEGLALDLDGNALRGAVSVAMAEPVQVMADLRGGALKVASDKAAGGAAAGAAPAKAGWSTAAIDASALSLMNGRIRLGFDSLAYGDVQLGQSDITTEVERARAVVRLAPVTVFGGQVEGQLVANNRSGLSVAAKLGFTNLGLEQLLGQTAGYRQLTGAASGQVDVLGVGASEDAILRSLRGTARIDVGRGKFTGFDLQGLMNPDGGNGGTTIFRDLGASFALEGGVARSSDFAADLEVLKATGAGRIGIGAQDMDFTFTPTAFGGAQGAGISVPVRVHGPWSNLSYTPDLSRIEELRALEKQAKTAVQEKLSEELGTQVETVEEAEDALRKRVEEEARKQLLKFLNRD